MNQEQSVIEDVKSKTNRGGYSATLGKIIEKRNQEIVKYVLEMKYLKAEQVREKFFKFAGEKADKYTSSAIEKLVELKYLGKGKAELLVVGAEGEKYMASVAGDLVVPKAHLRVWEPEVRHDLKLVDLRISFEERGYVERWYSENMMKVSKSMSGMFQDLPDALVMKKNGRGYFLELEISRKGNQRYVDRVLEYKRVLSTEALKQEKIEGVMFVCTDEKVKEVIEGVAKTAGVKCSVVMLNKYLPEVGA